MYGYQAGCQYIITMRPCAPSPELFMLLAPRLPPPGGCPVAPDPQPPLGELPPEPPYCPSIPSEPVPPVPPAPCAPDACCPGPPPFASNNVVPPRLMFVSPPGFPSCDSGTPAPPKPIVIIRLSPGAVTIVPARYSPPPPFPALAVTPLAPPLPPPPQSCPYTFDTPGGTTHVVEASNTIIVGTNKKAGGGLTISKPIYVVS